MGHPAGTGAGVGGVRGNALVVEEQLGVVRPRNCQGIGEIRCQFLRISPALFWGLRVEPVHFVPGRLLNIGRVTVAVDHVPRVILKDVSNPLCRL
jgi:hypothetical protein